jgi:hypothetical protein
MRAGVVLRASLSLCVTLGGALTSLDAVAQGPSPCDRVCLKGFVDDYLDALSDRDPSGLPVAADLKYTENGRVLELGDGFWKTAGAPLAYRDYVIDPDSGGAAALTALHEYEGIAQMFLRVKIVARQYAEIETFVVRVGDQRWFAPERLEGLSDLYSQTVPPNERHTREQLTAAANAYFTAVQTEGTPEFVQAPFAPGMKRIENGLQTTNVQENPVLERHTWSPDLQLERASYKGITVADRRFPVVDTEHGSVLGIVMFRRAEPDTTTLLLAEIFKVTGGKLREIRAVMLNLPHGAENGWTATR